MNQPRSRPARPIPLALTPGQQIELRRLWTEHAAALLAQLRRWCRDEADAADALQELFLRLARSPRLVLAAENPRALLAVAARRIAIDAARRRQAGQRREEQLAASGTVSELVPDARSDADLRAAIARAVRALSPDQRAVFEARQLQGLTLAEIAQARGLSINTVASRFRYALDKIRAELRPYYDDMNSTHAQSPVLPADADQSRLIRPLEPKRMPSVAPGLEGLAALAPDDAHFDQAPVETIDDGLQAPPESELVAAEELFCGVDFGEVAWTDEIDPELFVCTLFPGVEETGGDVPEVVVCDFGFPGGGDVSFEDYFNLGDNTSTGAPEDGSVTTEGEPDEPEIYLVDGPEVTDGEDVPTPPEDYLNEYRSFLDDHPDWLSSNGIGEIQAQVMTPSGTFPDLLLSNPGEAKGFDLWFSSHYGASAGPLPDVSEAVVEEGSEPDGSLAEPDVTDGEPAPDVQANAGGDRDPSAEGVRPQFRENETASDLTSRSELATNREASAELRDFVSVETTAFERVALNLTDLDAPLPPGAAVEFSDFTDTTAPVAGTATNAFGAASSEAEFVPQASLPVSSGPTAATDTPAGTVGAGTALGAGLSTPARFTAPEPVAQAGLAAGLAGVLAANELKRRPAGPSR